MFKEFGSKIKSLFQGDISKRNFINKLEDILRDQEVSSDVIDYICQQFKDKIASDKVDDKEEIKDIFKLILRKFMVPSSGLEGGTYLVIGKSGSGKTSSVGSIASLIKNNKILTTSMDFIRNAAYEQLSKVVQGLDNVSMIQQETSSQATIDNVIKNSQFINLIDTSDISDDRGFSDIQSVIKENSSVNSILVINSTMSANSIVELIEKVKGLRVKGIMVTNCDDINRTTRIGAFINSSYLLQQPIFAIKTGEKVSDVKKFEVETTIKRITENSLQITDNDMKTIQGIYTKINDKKDLGLQDLIEMFETNTIKNIMSSEKLPIDVSQLNMIVQSLKAIVSVMHEDEKTSMKWYSDNPNASERQGKLERIAKSLSMPVDQLDQIFSNLLPMLKEMIARFQDPNSMNDMINQLKERSGSDSLEDIDINTITDYAAEDIEARKKKMD